MQDIATQGATDATFFNVGSDTFLIITNELTNDQRTKTNSPILLWTGVQFVAVASLASTGASGVKEFSINGDQYVAVAHYYDSTQASYEIKWVVSGILLHAKDQTLPAKTQHSVYLLIK